jgi:hypothetical protein
VASLICGHFAFPYLQDVLNRTESLRRVQGDGTKLAVQAEGRRHRLVNAVNKRESRPRAKRDPFAGIGGIHPAQNKTGPVQGGQRFTPGLPPVFDYHVACVPCDLVHS